MTSTASARPLRVGVVGLGWMGQVHARAYTRVGQHYLDTPLRPELVAVADTATDERVARAVAAYGFTDVHADWHELLERDDIDVVSITGPNFIHRDVAVAAAQAGLHLWLEKPAGRDAEETAEIAEAVAAAGVQSTVGFNYRNAPAVELARALVAEGRLGRVEQVRITMLADYAAHPEGALTWRYQNRWSGSGVLGDLVSHGVDLGRYVVGEVESLVCDTATFIPERPALSGAAFAHTARGGGPLAPVENEDYAGALLAFAGGARGTLESSRVAVGEQCTYGIEVHGDRGALAWDFRRMGELRVCLDQDYTDAAWATRFVAPGDGELGAFQPGSGIAMSYDDLKVVEAHRLVRSIAEGVPQGATITDALQAARLVDAMATSARDRRWVDVDAPRVSP
ncbi:Predicted dehydrogenase [Microlunatus sagamiharensis]|uniref:Predicted dehydrogenase n=1 Tax=Microlunatus sagamiharensis TaxID=546874 RepID=A0A1H2MDS9_9ACTN|nr:Gfo/Idh/MocA family oxidoreductase [Microlunatus sagamiharensis]SDU91282.1 Predicted dehydrogenase [Microlunatus sagamiharensis]